MKPRVLISRAKALLKRMKAEAGDPDTDHENRIVAGELVIDRERYLVIIDKNEISLPKKEFELLSLLISRPEKVFTREEIFDRVWGTNVVVGDRTIDVHIRKLREKLGDECIRTVKGIGYKFILPL